MASSSAAAATYKTELATATSEVIQDLGGVGQLKGRPLTDYQTGLKDGTAGLAETALGENSRAQTDFKHAEKEFDDMLHALGLPPL